jgi:hypothetical protein
MTLFYLSFCDPERPKGQQFLGCTIVDALSPVSAVREAWARSVNPGGEVAIVELDIASSADLPQEVKSYFNRLVPREEALGQPHRRIFDEETD